VRQTNQAPSRHSNQRSLSVANQRFTPKAGWLFGIFLQLPLTDR